MDSTIQFEYKPLKDREIRLLSWSSGHDKPDLIHVTIDQTPQYDALSYCWGYEYCLHFFQLQHGGIPITSSLQKALHQYQETPSNKMLWADGLCINQRDDAEKRQQIKLMADIFWRASCVLVSLGELTADARCAMVLIPYVMKKLESSSGVASFDMTQSGQWYEEDPFPLFWEGIAQIIHHPWFGRLWTLEEAVLASRLRFIGDGLFIGFEALSSLFTHLTKRRVMAKLTYGPFQDIRGLTSVAEINQYRYGLDKGLSTHDLILTIEKREALKAKDCVYGLLGILDKKVAQGIPTDKRLSVSSLYSHATRSIVEAESSVNILRLVHNEQSLDIPSWCINFSDKSRPAVLNRGSFGAGLSRTASTTSVETRPEFDGTVLVASGKILDKITDVFYPSLLEDDMGFDTSILQIIACLQFAMERQHRLDDFLRQFAETICGGYLPGPNRLYKPGDLRSFHAMVAFVLQGEGQYTQLMDRHSDYIVGARAYTKNRAFFLTQKGGMGIGPLKTQVGDVTSILMTAEVPFVLRKTMESQLSYQLVGHAYVPGVMQGEAVVDQSISSQGIRLI